jgi:hypothetical protein
MANPNHPTTQPGYQNRNGQIVVGPTDLPGTDHLQRIYILRCALCQHEYGGKRFGYSSAEVSDLSGRRGGFGYKPIAVEWMTGGALGIGKDSDTGCESESCRGRKLMP